MIRRVIITDNRDNLCFRKKSEFFASPTNRFLSYKQGLSPKIASITKEKTHLIR